MNLKNVVLGTAQFGMNYGVVNKQGKPNEKKVFDILSLFFEKGGEWFDTAPAYGDSEVVLGKVLKNFSNSKIITKTPIDNSSYRKSFECSLKHLNCDSLHGLLVHRPEELLEDKCKIKELISLKDEKLVLKIGVSVYDPTLISKLIQVLDFDIVQAPCNVFDQRILDAKVLDELQKNRIEVHARSLYLQGILLTPYDQLPKSFDSYLTLFKEYQEMLKKHDLTLMQGALVFFETCANLHKSVIGVDSMMQLDQIARCETNVSIERRIYEKFRQNRDDLLINPSRWGELG